MTCRRTLELGQGFRIVETLLKFAQGIEPASGAEFDSLSTSGT